MDRSSSKYKYGAIVCLAMILLSLLPQIHLWLVRGREWNGAYVSPQGDEPLYSAYVASLMIGRSRKNDPYDGKDSLPYESIFSIQFVPAYAIALPARLFHVSASSAFIVLIGLSALFSALAVFWLLNVVTSDPRLAAAGTLFILCLGGFFGSYGMFGTPMDIALPGLPFLSRYQPAATFPLYFIFAVLVWRAFIQRWFGVLAGIVLAVLMFSYLYLWTAAAAWLICFAGLRFCFRPSDRRATLSVLAIIGSIAAVALVLYAYFLAHRVPTTDYQQFIISTHRPDLFHVTEILGAIIILIVIAMRRVFDYSRLQTIAILSLGLLPFIVFNQQIVSGRTLQAFHFESYSVNYYLAAGLI